MEKLITVKFNKDDLPMAPLLWNAMYSVRAGIPAAKLRIHNSILDELERVLDVGFETEPVYEILQMTQGITTLAVHRINAGLDGIDEINLEFNPAQFDYLKGILNQTQWMPAVSRLAEKLSEKFEISS